MRPTTELFIDKYLERSIVGAEIGVASGIHAKELYTYVAFKKLVLVDVWENIESNASYLGDFDIYYDCVKDLFKGCYNVDVMKSYSLEASKKFDDEYFDFVYLDAGHSFEDVYNDLTAWYRKVKTGGVICGHDYMATDPFIPDVKNAVDLFCSENNLEVLCADIKNKTYLNSDWWAIK